MDSIKGRIIRLNDWDLAYPAFQYDNLTAPSKQLGACIDRWRGQDDRLASVLAAMKANDPLWDNAISTPPAINDLQGAGGGASFGGGPPRPYKRDLRGTHFDEVNLRLNIDALNYTALDFCSFTKCNFDLFSPNPSFAGLLPFLFSSQVNYARFEECIFKNASWHPRYLTNSIFYNCEFTNVVFNRNLDGVYERLFFMNCKFDGVDLSRTRINSWCFWGPCTFNSLTINNQTIDLGQPVASDILKFCKDNDRANYRKRKRLTGVTFTWDVPTNTRETVVNYIKSGEPEVSVPRYAQTISCYEGQANLYLALTNTETAKRAPGLSSEFDYRFAWHMDEMATQVAIGSQKIIPFLKAAFGRHFMGYGNKPWKPLVAWLAMVLIFPVGYLYSGLQGLGAPIERSFHWDYSQFAGTITDYFRCLYFSVVTATTVGFGDFAPTSAVSRAFAAIEATTAAVLIPIFTVCLTRRYLRK